LKVIITQEYDCGHKWSYDQEVDKEKGLPAMPAGDKFRKPFHCDFCKKLVDLRSVKFERIDISFPDGSRADAELFRFYAEKEKDLEKLR
jgi:hypothetical protein